MESGAVRSIVNGGHLLDVLVHWLLPEGESNRRASRRRGYLSELLTPPSGISQYDARLLAANEEECRWVRFESVIGLCRDRRLSTGVPYEIEQAFYFQVPGFYENLYDLACRCLTP